MSTEMEAMIQELEVEDMCALLTDSVFHISNCTVECQVKFSTCTLLGGALTWWNSHVRTIGHDASYGMPLKKLIEMMTKNYCPMSEIKSLKLWNLKVKGTDVGNMMSARPKTLQETIKLAKDLMGQKVRTYAERQADNKRSFEKLKNQNLRNQSGNDEACGRVYALRGRETDQDPNNIEDDIDV
uniref:Reverse transcriptase domain-containing protein n=1 Tax=Tanacetum cinerariifolium TaxID=118510 RepID=A0A6L2N9V1_TANCI|nr:hypothetical protein [Tanacetum cinerariifolium]